MSSSERQLTLTRMRVEAAGAQAIAALDRAGIETLLLKGPVTRELVGDPQRVSADCDLLTRVARAHEATTVLERAGWDVMTETWKISGHPALKDHSIELTRDGAALDLHYRLPGIADEDRAWFALFARRRQIEYGGGLAWAVDAASGLVLLCIARITDGPTRRAADDLRRALRQQPTIESWSEARAVADEIGVLDLFGAALSGDAKGREIAHRLQVPTVVESLSLRLLARGAPSPAVTAAELYELRASPGHFARRLRTAVRPTPAEAPFQGHGPPLEAGTGPGVRVLRIARVLPASVRALRDTAREESAPRLPLALRVLGAIRWLLDSGHRLLFEVTNEVAYRTVPGNRMDELTFRHYVDSGRYVAEFPDEPLYAWESDLVGAPPAPGANRLLLGGAGAGRELVGFARRGWQVSAFEPSDLFHSLAAAAGEHPDCRALRGAYADLISAVNDERGPLLDYLDVRYDGVVLGWGSYTHVLTTESRIALLEAAARMTAPGAWLLLSYMADERGGRWRQLGRAWRTRTRKGDAAQLSYTPAMGFFALLSADQVEAEAARAGWDQVEEHRTDGFPHLLLRRSLDQP